MPQYVYECKSCLHNWEAFSSIADRDIPLSEPCPGCKEKTEIFKVIGLTSIGDPVRLGHIKPKDDFREVMKTMKKNVPGNNLPDF